MPKTASVGRRKSRRQATKPRYSVTLGYQTDDGEIRSKLPETERAVEVSSPTEQLVLIEREKGGLGGCFAFLATISGPGTDAISLDEVNTTIEALERFRDSLDVLLRAARRRFL